MLIFKNVAGLRQWLCHFAGPTGFVPTMGALHDGHLELVRTAKRDGCLTVASIFVNPTQFNDPRDLEEYPRTPERDVEMLLKAGCDALFMPPVEEVYPPGEDVSLNLDFRHLDKVMEGLFRPGHFAGMATVVNRLLDIVEPRKLYMGQKDFQQLAIVRDMVRQLSLPVEVVMCPTVREPDGLAMSSRNMRLSPAMRAAAPAIYRTLLWAKEALRQDLPVPDIQAAAMRKLMDAGLRPEYFEILDGNTLCAIPPTGIIDLLDEEGDEGLVVAFAAAFAGDVRLIDNLPLYP